MPLPLLFEKPVALATAAAGIRRVDEDGKVVSSEADSEGVNDVATAAAANEDDDAGDAGEELLPLLLAPRRPTVGDEGDIGICAAFTGSGDGGKA